MTRKHANLSKAARSLYLTMRGLASGKSGELAIRGNPFDWKYIARKAEIGRDVWQRCIKELLAAGLVSRLRERVCMYRDGRKRAVLGRAHYFVHRQPKTAKKPKILLMPDFSTVEESGRQIFQKHLEAWSVAADSLASDELKSGNLTEESSKAPVTDDDFLRVNRDYFSLPKFISASEEILQKEHPQWKRWQVQAAIWTVAVNAFNSGKVPRSAQYFVAGVRAFSPSDLEFIETYWNEKSFRAWLTHTQENLQTQATA